MPIINYDGGRMTREQKAELVTEFTETASRITGINKEVFVVIINEHDMENIGSGGQLLADKLKK